MLRYILALLQDVLAVGLIPWIAAGLCKKPMTKRRYKWVSVVFSLCLTSAAMASDYSFIRAFAAMECVCLCFSTYYIGLHILKRRGKLEGYVKGELTDD